MKLKAALLVAAATGVAAPAAHAYEGLYGAIGAGISYMVEDRDFETQAPGLFAVDGDADFDNGIGIYTALGYAYDNHWRTELEFSYRSNDIRHIAGNGSSFSGFPEGTLSGDVSSYNFLANLIYDFDFGSSFMTPYVGVGAGLARVKADFTGTNPVGANGFTTVGIDDGDLNFAYQGIAGVAFKLAENLMLDVSYRYFATEDPDFVGMAGGAASGFNTEYATHNLFAGLRWNFGAAAAPVKVQYKDCWDGSSVPASAECPPQLVEKQSATAEPIDVIVYFDYDKSNLTPEAAELIREAASRALAGDIERVKVEGNADRSGSSAYNQALSQRRANVVRDALVANGVPAGIIDTTSFGEDNPAKPTADGVREPLNRRTEVHISFE
ncbi:MAG: OmpA family protein [Pseudomonadota bacterium]|nr:OmpA family protein [Pseudomonadota bacterium]